MVVHFDTQFLDNHRVLNALIFYESEFDTSIKSFIHQLIVITRNEEAFYRMEGSDAERAPLFMSESNHPESLEFQKAGNGMTSVNLDLPIKSKTFRDKVTGILSRYLTYDEFNFTWDIAQNAPENTSADFKIPQKFLKRIQGFNWPDS